MELSPTIKKVGSVALVITVFTFLPGILSSLKDKFGTALESRDQVAVIQIKETLTDSSKFHKQLHTYFKDNTIKAIVIKMECPGGAAGTSQAVYNEIKTLKATYPKPIVTLVENMCASGGYYIAAATDYIIAPGSALVGSIGTAFSNVFQLREFLEQFKIKTVPLTAGTYKAAANPLADMTPAEKELLQTLLNDSYDQFISDIAQARSLDAATHKQWGDGKIFTARQAAELKLVDEVGSYSSLLTYLKEKAGISEDVKWVCEAKKRSVLDWISGQQDDDSCGIFGAFADVLITKVEQRLTQRLQM